MIRITQLKLPVEHGPEELKRKAARLLKVRPEEIREIYVRRQSLDARKKPELFYSYTLDIEMAPEKRAGKDTGKTVLSKKKENALIHKAKSSQVTAAKENRYRFVETGKQSFHHPPVIVGAGPAGLFCGWMLARHGYCPVILERGEDVDTRKRKVDRFWETGCLDECSHVQFGEGGAGTFSDGKLNTLVKDTQGRNRLVLEIFHQMGADETVLYQHKPHIGTDVLGSIVKAMREEILRQGGHIRFGCQVTDLVIKDGRVCAVRTGQGETVAAEAVVLAVGHSARDTFFMLEQKGIPLSPKAFAVGLRIQHSQSMINLSQYGREDAGSLGAADYKVTAKTAGGRGVYSFCMCPGGYVINASSETGRLAVNGMSYHARAGVNANSALVVTVTPEDFPGHSPLAGVVFQQQLEEAAYRAAGGKIPLQLYEDFRAGRMSRQLGDIKPQMKGAWELADCRQILPEVLNGALLEAMESFGRTIRGFDRGDALLAGVESRTSSPVRIWRDQSMESQIKGIYPCGEGAGYAGGITSAAMDGVRAAEAIAGKYAPIKS